jgi:hypothetical protein
VQAPLILVVVGHDLLELRLDLAIRPLTAQARQCRWVEPLREDLQNVAAGVGAFLARQFTRGARLVRRGSAQRLIVSALHGRVAVVSIVRRS